MLGAVVADAARRFGDRPAFISGGREGHAVSFGELDRFSDEVAEGLCRRGVGEGDVVAVVLPTVVAHVVVYIAAARIGAVTAAVNAALTAPERAAVLVRAAPRLVVTTQGTLSEPPVGADVVELPLDEYPDGSARVDVDELRVPGGAPPPLAEDPERPVAIVFTSGTTGTPKGAVFAGRQLAFITRCDVGEAWGGGGRTLVATSLAHLGPMTKLPGNLRRGTTQYLMGIWRAREALGWTQDLRLTALGGVPTQIALMLRDERQASYDLSSLRAVVMGGGPAAPALVREARARFGAPVAVRYSCTEAGIGCGTALDAPDRDAEVSVGRPQPGVAVAVRSPDGAALPAGEIGEVCLASPAVMSGYFHDADASAAVFSAPGEVRTGDLGFVDGEGRLVLAGRAQERYVRGGYNVYPMEVEAVLAGHPSIAAVAVIARKDPVMGEVGVAAVVARPGCTAPSRDELRRFAGDRLARHKLPDEVAEVDALPLTPAEKIDRATLERMVAAAQTTPSSARRASSSAVRPSSPQ